MRIPAIAYCFVLILLGASEAPGGASERPVSEDPGRLVLILVVDQARYDYLERFGPLLEGGLKRLMETGVVFTDGHQNHAVTSTGPGHASVATGRHPRRSGIIGNGWFERELNSSVNCVEDRASPLLRSSQPEGRQPPASEGRSPRNLLVSSLGDWIKESDPRSKVFGASRKDRGAILLAGKKADGAYWYDSSNGEFVSSQYYMKDLPDWVHAFNAEKQPDAFFGKAWEPLPVDPEVYRKLGIEPADTGWFHSTFPHALGSVSFSPNSTFYSNFGGSPWGDWHLMNFARRLIEEEKLGRRGAVDLLGLSFSSLDSVGHGFGPDSPELLDCILRLDRLLGELFGYLEAQVGLDRVVIALSSDHGVVPLPEVRQARGEWGQRAGAEHIACFQRLGKALVERLGEHDWILTGNYLNYETIGRNNLRRQEVESELARLIEACPDVEKVWTRSELTGQQGEGSDPFFGLYWRSFHPERSPDFYVQRREFFLTSSGFGTTHGSPYRYDTHVPIIFWTAEAAPARISSRAATVDVAPTLGALLGLDLPDDLDGVDHSHHLRRTPALPD